ncbi:MAG: L-2-amino-thiazoline-4-carboxylic acid hydrolase [Leptospiraceae bacterium]|nr:L-2-amino-thiazoline-4-carboxylic acid hydrolase [Leptospiraceae bacterium]
MQRIPISEISKLPYYGNKFPFIPYSFQSKIKVSIVFAKHLYKMIGFFPFLLFWLFIPFHLYRTNSKYKEGVRLMGHAFGFMARIEWLLLLVIYDLINNKYGKEKAYQFSKNAIQDASKFMMNDFYQADILAKFEDPFEAFWEYHKAMFANDPNYPNEFIEDTDCKVMIVKKCQNCEISKLSIPDLAPLGCDHDITGYKSIEDKVNMEFRRPQTLAKDGLPCKFMFFRKGSAPENLEIK